MEERINLDLNNLDIDLDLFSAVLDMDREERIDVLSDVDDILVSTYYLKLALEKSLMDNNLN